MLIIALCLIMVAAGIIYGWWPQIAEWFQGGEAQIEVRPENRGKKRHAPEHNRLRLSTRDGQHWALVTALGVQRVVWDA